MYKLKDILPPLSLLKSDPTFCLWQNLTTTLMQPKVHNYAAV